MIQLKRFCIHKEYRTMAEGGVDYDPTVEEDRDEEKRDSERDLDQRLGEKDRAQEEIKKKYKKADTSKFSYRYDDYGNVRVRIFRSNAIEHPLSDINKKGFPVTIRNALLGIGNEEAVIKLDGEIEERQKEDEELRLSELSAPTERERENIRSQRERIREDIEEKEEIREEIVEEMSLRDRIRMIFKKYGVTATAIALAVGTTIGVIVSSLSKGLASMAKGVANSLKDLGKRIAQILPGMVGAIVSFLFKTAGEVVGFLGKKTWLLILGAVMFAVEQFKKKHE